jgi:hypothetical protein
MEPKDIRERIIKDWIDNEIIDITDIVIEEIEEFNKLK